LRCMKEAAALSPVAYERHRALGVLYTYMNQPGEALAAFARAEEESPYRGGSADLGNSFNAQLAEGRARAYRELNEYDHAVEQQELAVKLSPENGVWWAELAELYAAQGQPEKAEKARERAKSLQANSAAKPSEAPGKQK